MAQRRRVRGNIERLPSGHYWAIVYAGVDPLTGRERRLKRTAETHADAKQYLTALQRQVDQHQHPKSAITVREAIEQWLEVAELEVSAAEPSAPGRTLPQQVLGAPDPRSLTATWWSLSARPPRSPR